MAQSGPIERAGDQVLITTRPIRTDLVARVRAQIESGEYETARRLDVAAEAMIRAVSNS
jgi:anti-sigma28 factor (negative regulator of flagellin synthesis)